MKIEKINEFYENKTITMSYNEFESILYAHGALKAIEEIQPDLYPGLQGIIEELDEVVQKYKEI